MWSGEPASRETLPAGRGQADWSRQHWVPAHLHQESHGAALTQAGGLQKLVLMLEGLRDFKIKM